MASDSHSTSRSLAGQLAVVTGAAQGLGRAIVETLIDSGARVVATDINAAALIAACAELSEPSAAIPCPGDISDASFIERLMSSCDQQTAPLSILVNNAGILQRGRLDQITAENWDRMMAVNVKAVFLTIQAASRRMRGNGYGHIVNVASDAGKSVSTLGGCHYTASKAAVLGLTRHLARELAADGILVNAVCPGLIDTPMSRNNTDSTEWERICSGLPLRRANTPEEIATMVGFLCSRQCQACLGASIDVNGGSFLG